MSPNIKRKAKNGLRFLRSVFSSTTFHFTCAPGCGNRSLRDDVVFHPLPIRPKSPTHYHLRRHHHHDVVSSPTFSLNLHRQNYSNDFMTKTPPSLTPRRSSACSASSSKLGESVAVVKESDDPYQDFRHSMLQMIFEKEIFTQEDLQELLACFLRLNSPCHHDDIISAFSEIWGSVMSPAALANPSPTFRGY